MIFFHLQEICNKPNSRVSGTILFGFDISFLQQIRENIAYQSQPVNHKRPYTELKSQSQKNKRISMVGKDIAAQTLTILKENKFTSASEEIIATIEAIILKINDEVVEFHFHSNNITDITQHQDSIIRACDETLISRDGYRRLAKAIPHLVREYVIEKRRNEITKTMKALVPIKLFKISSSVLDSESENQQDINETEFNDNEVGDAAYRSIISLLDIIVPILTTSSTPPVLKVGDKINIRLSGDGRNVGRKQKHVMLTMCILNEGEVVLTPSHQYRSYIFLIFVSLLYLLIIINPELI